MVTFVESTWLRQHLSDPDIVTIDPRSVVKYLEGHIPNSVNLPLGNLLDSKSLALKPIDRVSEVFGETGIDTNASAVLYDSYDGQAAAMLAWVLEYLGHPKVNVLSSRLEGWTSGGGEVLYKPVKRQAVNFGPKPNNALRALSRDVLHKGGSKLLDLRSRDEFQGKVATEIRTGHIPGALNLPWTELIGGGHDFLRSKPDLETITERIGLKPSETVVTYCSYGPRAAIGYLALQDLGYDVRVYDGSFHQWAQSPELPVEGEGLQIQF